MSVTLEIVTPEARVYENTVSTVVLPTREGEIGILEGHIPLISILEPGEIQVEKDGKREFLAVDKGYVQIIANKVSVLTEAAIDVEAINMDEVLEARKRAEEALEDAKHNTEIEPAELERLEAQLRFTLTQEMAKAKHRMGK